jgi:lipopolysaccharide/colanic/teichoic acid biosynthesis glycosyltransferase
VLKRSFDVFVAALLLLILAPVLFVVAILVRLDSPGPVLYRPTRVGKDGVPFTLLKLRSMVDGAVRLGPRVTRGGDPRITRVGRFLRKSKLDELPQLVNVLRGDMSLVGPRPEDGRYVALYTKEQRRILSVRPGLTGLASVRYRDEETLLARADGGLEETYVDVVLPAKLSVDLEYVERQSLLLDLLILWRTALALPWPLWSRPRGQD